MVTSGLKCGLCVGKNLFFHTLIRVWVTRVIGIGSIHVSIKRTFTNLEKRIKKSDETFIDIRIDNIVQIFCSIQMRHLFL